MKALQTIQAVGLSCLLSIGAASCGSEESNQPYTPLQVYFDQLDCSRVFSSLGSLDRSWMQVPFVSLSWGFNPSKFSG